MTEREEPCQHVWDTDKTCCLLCGQAHPKEPCQHEGINGRCRGCGRWATAIIADLRAKNERRECGICHQMTLIRNPHPDAGKPERLVEVGAEWVCHQCALTANKRVRDQLADAEARAERLREALDFSPVVQDDGFVALHIQRGGNAVILRYRNPKEGSDDMRALREWAARVDAALAELGSEGSDE